MEYQLENIMIHYESFGEGKLIVMLHGWPADSPTCVRFLELTLNSETDGSLSIQIYSGLGKLQEWIGLLAKMMSLIYFQLHQQHYVGVRDFTCGLLH